MPPPELKMTRDPNDVHVWELPTFGRVRLPPKPWGELLVFVPGRPEWTVSKAERHTYQAVENGAAVATADHFAQSIVSGAREWIIPKAPMRTFRGLGPWIVLEQGREIITFARREWGWRPPGVAIIDEAAARADPRLTLLAAWTANRLSISVVI